MLVWKLLACLLIELQFVIHLLLETHDLLAWYDKWHTNSINFSVLCFTIWHDAMRLPLLKAMKWAPTWYVWADTPNPDSSFFKKKLSLHKRRLVKWANFFFQKKITVLQFCMTWWESLLDEKNCPTFLIFAHIRRYLER